MFKRVAFLLVLFALGCSSSSASPSATTIYNTWVYTNGDSGQGLTIRKDNTYTYSILRLLSASSFDVYSEDGSVAITDSSFAFTPVQWSCTGTNPPSSATYSLNGDALDVAFASGVTVFQLDSSTSASNIQLTYGCFDTTGTFTPHPLGNGT